MNENKRKEIRRQYLEDMEERKVEDGVYKVENKVNGRFFIGSTRDVTNLNGLRFQLNMGGFLNRELQKDWDTYGEDQFEITILETFEQGENRGLNAKKRVEMERKWKETLHAYGEKGYHKKANVSGKN